MFNPKVSIIIPVYNGSNFLKEAIDSALDQAYKNIEIIVINDGSNDNGATEKIAKSYGNKIKYFKKDNGGVATALNLGIKKMSGEYFSWLSHDDMYYPNKIERQIDFLNGASNRKIVLYSNYALLKEGRITPVINNHEMLSRKKKYALLRGCVNGITPVIPKAIIDEIGLFKEELRCTQDYDYWHRIQKKYDFVHMQDVISVTRIHGNQDSFVSPAVVSEGNALWIKMIKDLSIKEKKQYESTLHNFYFEMIKFLKTTPYNGAIDYCNKELSNLNVSKLDNLDYKVSVVIPFYNRPKEVINAIKSVQAQTYKNIDILLVNDASTVDISPIVDYVKNHKNTVLINVEKNLGPAGARNIGIKAATGDYVAFLDSDDEFVEEKISYQLFEMSKHNLDVSYTPYIKRCGGVDSIVSGHGISGIIVPRIISSCPIATPTVIIRREILIGENIFFNELIRIGEDTCFWLEIAKQYEILLVENPLTIVNINNSSHAYSNDKLVIGMRNIIAYLTSDSYYSNYYYDISLLCNDFHTINKNIQLENEEKLKINNYLAPSFWQIIINRTRRTIAYRVARKVYSDGSSATVKTIIYKLKDKKKNYNPKLFITVHDHEDSSSFETTIDSALSKARKNIEIIVVNNGPSDNDAIEKIAKSYGNKVRYLMSKKQ